MVSAAMFVGACTSAPTPDNIFKRTDNNREYFAESEYGVSASPRVSNLRTRLPRGGGRDMVGKPYKVRGRWYKPAEDPDYVKVGAASWYGDAFHGRLTANGEVYDMTHLTAAHPTMPLPSYARVTNQNNGASIVVRVNDRGPFAHGRIIDLSKRAAEMLDYTHAGVAKVKVEYLGRAPLHGQDDQYLLASYSPGNARPDRTDERLPGINDGLPTGVMVAMNGRTPTGGMSLRRRSLLDALPGGRRSEPPATVRQQPQPIQVASAEAPQRSSRLTNIVTAADPILPDAGPFVPERPFGNLVSDADRLALPIMSYADRRVRQASAAAEPFDAMGLDAQAVVSSWKHGNGESADATTDAWQPASDYLAAGTFITAEAARTRADLLAQLGTVKIVRDGESYLVVVQAESRALDDLARQAWNAGAADAFVVRIE